MPAEFHETRPAIIVQSRYCKVFEMEPTRKIFVFKSHKFQINVAAFVKVKSVRDDQSLKLGWMKFECLSEFKKINQACYQIIKHATNKSAQNSRETFEFKCYRYQLLKYVTV
jgi:hypothetical protein